MEQPPTAVRLRLRTGQEHCYARRQRIFYTVGLEGGTNTGFSISTPYISSVNGNVTPTNYFASGTPFPNCAQVPPGNSLGLSIRPNVTQMRDVRLRGSHSCPGVMTVALYYSAVADTANAILAKADQSERAWAGPKSQIDSLLAGSVQPLLMLMGRLNGLSG